MAHESRERVFRAVWDVIKREAEHAEGAGVPAHSFFLEAFQGLVRSTAHLVAHMVTPADDPKGEKRGRARRLEATFCQALDQIMRYEWKEANGTAPQHCDHWLPEDGGHL